MPSRLFLTPSLLALSFVALACNSSQDSLPGLGDEFDIAALSEPVLRLCGATECGDYSRYECEFYLRFDALEYARFSEDPEGCLAALQAEYTCLADAASCDEESCYALDDACQLVQQVPDIEVPPAVQPTQVTCEFRAGCESEQYEFDHEAVIAECQVEYISRAEIFQHDLGPACAQAFIDFITCIGEAGLPCSPSGDEEDAACPAESAAFTSACAGDEE